MAATKSPDYRGFFCVQKNHTPTQFNNLLN
jgi:hypothetical protein